MAASHMSDSASGAGELRKSSPTVIVVLGLSLATWAFFYLKSMTLTVKETTVVVGFWLVVALSVKWAWAVCGKKGQPRENRE